MMLAGKTNRYESDTSELGLALAYDIVKAHGGEIRVETKGAREVSLLFSCQFNRIFHTRRKGDVCVYSQSDENGMGPRKASEVSGARTAFDYF